MTKITLTVNEKARKEANLRLLKRTVDRNIVDIVGDYTATHVVLYLFHPETQSWEKSNIEGSLSLVQQQEGTKTKYALVILNRNSPENYCMELTRDFQLQQNDPYLIFKNYDDDGDNGNTRQETIRGIWFPNDKERLEMNDLFTNILDVLRSTTTNSQSSIPTLRSVASVEEAHAEGAASSSFKATATTTTTATTVAPNDRNAATAALFASLNIGGVSNGGDAAAAAATTPTQTTTTSRSASASVSSTTQQQRSGRIQNTNTNATDETHQQPTLDKKSLQLALLSLIQDERFLDLLHAQYLKVHHARTKK